MSYPHYSGECADHHDLVRDFGGERPLIVVLCGSTRFYAQFQQANYALTMEGRIVLSVGFYPHAKTEHGHGEGVGHDSAEKTALDELHKRKIDLADWVMVVSEGGYFGDSTAGEIVYAVAQGKTVLFAEETARNRAADMGLLSNSCPVEAVFPSGRIPCKSQRDHDGDHDFIGIPVVSDAG